MAMTHANVKQAASSSNPSNPHLHARQLLQLLWAPERCHGARGQVELHREPDAEAWAQGGGKLGQHAVGRKELLGLVAHGRQRQQPRLDQLTQSRSRAVVGRAVAQHLGQVRNVGAER